MGNEDDDVTLLAMKVAGKECNVQERKVMYVYVCVCVLNPHLFGSLQTLALPPLDKEERKGGRGKKRHLRSHLIPQFTQPSQTHTHLSRPTVRPLSPPTSWVSLESMAGDPLAMCVLESLNRFDGYSV